MLDKNIKLTCNMILVDRDKEKEFFFFDECTFSNENQSSLKDDWVARFYFIGELGDTEGGETS